VIVDDAFNKTITSLNKLMISELGAKVMLLQKNGLKNKSQVIFTRFRYFRLLTY
jgi:hypothetical protein